MKQRVIARTRKIPLVEEPDHIKKKKIGGGRRSGTTTEKVRRPGGRKMAGDGKLG